MSRVPQSDQMRASGSGRRRVPLPPGRSQLDWIRNSAKLPYIHPRSISVPELRSHRMKDDAWTCINGRVYNISHYVEYHPGGADMILAGAGKDSTKLFNKYHSWVNPEYMLARCYLGDLEATGDADDDIDGQSDETEEERADPVV